MIRRTVLKSALLAAVAAAVHSPGAAAQQAHSFYVLHQRTVSLTAQYWNPILTYVGRKSGVALDLKLTKTAQEGNANAEAGAYDFLYTNHFFTPERDRLGYKVIARPAGPGIRSEIVVPVLGRGRELIAVLDVDSERLNAFDAEDRAGLERLMRWFES